MDEPSKTPIRKLASDSNVNTQVAIVLLAQLPNKIPRNEKNRKLDAGFASDCRFAKVDATSRLTHSGDEFPSPHELLIVIALIR